ncbi:MAG: PHP domain-containing protein [Chloroflexi bacterium]|nr:PHP domain-containing protein [Chloroflexota bacterium]
MTQRKKVYATLGLPYIIPTLRQDTGEIEAAQNGRLPAVIQLSDIISDLHMHTTWSDGKLSVLDMAQAAKAQGLHYIAITDHSHSLGIANGLDEERLWQMVDDVQNVNAALGPDFRVLYGTEMEVKADGSLDFPDDVLMELDFVIASLHTSLSQTQAQITERMLQAIHNPHVDMIAHPTGRLLPDRPGADLDIELVLKTAVATQTILEINANPQRLDLRDVHVRRAVELGAILAINTDAHHPTHFQFRHFGVAVGQRGWLPKEQVVNSWPLAQFLTFIKRENWL